MPIANISSAVFFKFAINQALLILWGCTCPYIHRTWPKLFLFSVIVTCPGMLYVKQRHALIRFNIWYVYIHRKVYLKCNTNFLCLVSRRFKLNMISNVFLIMVKRTFKVHWWFYIYPISHREWKRGLETIFESIRRGVINL